MAVRTIDVRERVMAKNDEIAQTVRERLRAAGVAGCCAYSRSCLSPGQVPARCDEPRWPAFVEKPDLETARRHPHEQVIGVVQARPERVAVRSVGHLRNDHLGRHDLRPGRDLRDETVQALVPRAVGARRWTTAGSLTSRQPVTTFPPMSRAWPVARARYSTRKSPSNWIVTAASTLTKARQ